MPVLDRNFDYVVLDMIESAVRAGKTNPLNLGGIAGSGGGYGGPPGGFIGVLPQTKVAYDIDEIASSGIPASGYSLLDNLNHIRYRLGVVESGGAGLITVVDDNTPATYANIDTVHFSGAGVTVVDLGGGDIQAVISAAGSGGGISLTVADISGSPTVNSVDKITFSGVTVTDQGSGDVLIEADIPSISGLISEAPIDGSQYARKDAGWTVVSGWTTLTVDDITGSPTITDVDKITFSGVSVTDLGSGDVLVAADIPSISGLISEAPIDGSQYARKDADWVVVSGGSGASSFLDLTDTPTTYSGQYGKVATVNSTEDGLEFTTISGGSSAIANIDQSGGTSDTYGTLTGSINGSNTTFTVAAGSYASGSLSVYLNGQLQTQGSSEDWVETAPASGIFDFNTAPIVGDEISVIYGAERLGVGSSIIDTSGGGGLGGVVNSSNVNFTTSQPYITETLMVYRNGQLMTKDVDWTETTPTSGTFAFTTAPTTGDVITAVYGLSLTSINGYLKADGSTIWTDNFTSYSSLPVGYARVFTQNGGLYIQSAPAVAQELAKLLSVINNHGWILKTQTWTRTGNHTFTISGDYSADPDYQKGVKVRYKDGGSYEYGVIYSAVYSAPNTTITLITNSNYAMAAATITDTYISKIEKPDGFPDAFDYTPVGSSGYTLGNGTLQAKWSATRNEIFVTIRFILGSTSAITGDIRIGAPVAQGFPQTGIAVLQETGVNSFTTIVIVSASLFYIRAVAASGTYASIAFCSATVPFTWGTDDEIDATIQYRF